MAGKGVQTYETKAASNIGLGQAGSILVTGVAHSVASRGVYVAIQFLEDTKFNTSTTAGLVAEANHALGTYQFPNSRTGASDIGTNGAAAASQVFPKGITIFGRWTSFQLAEGAVIAYVG